MDELTERSAREVVDLLRGGDVSPHEALDAVEQRVAEVDDQVNALPIRCFERARSHADRLTQLPPNRRGLLGGLPVPIKDLNDVSGVLNTFGSKLRSDNVPDTSDILVEHLEAEGAVVYAKSNTPEFGAGGNTFNEVHGPTRNPHDLRLTAGGSSGGAAAALASGTAWLAHGSDLAGSLRTPASFCGVTSLRPSPGLIASGPNAVPFLVHPQQGPMARDIADLALFTDAMVGESPLAGLCKPPPSESFRSAAGSPIRPSRVAFSLDLGVAETSPEVAAICLAAIASLEGDGIDVVPDHPDLSDAEKAFAVPRALMYSTLLGADLPANRDVFKPELIANIEEGLALDGDDIRSSLHAQGRVFRDAAEFMLGYDLLICPASIVPPFPVEERYLGYSDGLPANEYFRWLSIVYTITATTLPVISIPCGHTTTGLPVGLQLIGPPHGERRMFALARHIERVFGLDPRPVRPDTSNPTR